MTIITTDKQDLIDQVNATGILNYTVELHLAQIYYVMYT